MLAIPFYWVSPHSLHLLSFGMQERWPITSLSRRHQQCYQDFLTGQDNTGAHTASRGRHGDEKRRTEMGLGAADVSSNRGKREVDIQLQMLPWTLDLEMMWLEWTWISGKDRSRSYMVYLNKSSVHYPRYSSGISKPVILLECSNLPCIQGKDLAHKGRTSWRQRKKRWKKEKDKK